jgi:DNA-binding YbaB/EbfC family protein
VNGEVEVICTGNREVKEVKINDSLFKIRDREEIEAWVIEATNNALRQAEQLAEAEMRAIMPNIPGLT